jgi:hypothetical protein
MCGAGSVTGATCKFDVMSADTDCANFQPPVHYTVGSMGGHACYGVALPAFEITTPVVDAGVCTFAGQTSTKPDAVFARGAAACGVSTAPPACADRPDCLQPPPAAAPFGRVCVHQAGDVACPSADYAARFVAYRSVADERACSPCAGSTAGVTCPTTFGTAGMCAVGAVDSVEFTNTCVNRAPNISFLVVSDLAPNPGSCPPTDGGVPTGDAHGVDPVTFCCVR